ncbi:TIGR02302 family protein [Rhodovibrio salinarum]|nr:TIGR02302 family protein [Rhodovibrio salinarum]
MATNRPDSNARRRRGSARTSQNSDHDRVSDLLPGLGWRLSVARLAVAWERIWPQVWPATALLALFLAAGLTGALPALGFWLHSLALLAFAVGFVWLLLRGLRRIRLPNTDEARRRLERDSGFTHRPLAGLDDQLATGGEDPATAALWQAHLHRLRATIRRLRVKPPHGSLAKVDPVGLRAVPVLLLVVGLVVAGANAPERLARATLPAYPTADVPAPQVDVWIDPPAYTGQAPRYLAPAGEDKAARVNLPDGSRLLAQVSGGTGEPVLELGDRTVPLERAAAGAWKTEIELSTAAGPALAIRQDEETLASWQLSMTPDAAPRVRFKEPPQGSDRNALKVAYRATDDYGVERVRLRLTRPADDPADSSGDAETSADTADDPGSEQTPEAIAIDLPLAGGEPGTVENTSYHDLTAHPWAGTQVQATLLAEDARGQQASSEAVQVTLPQRTFTHPVARRLVELRRQLTLNPDKRYPVIRELNGIGQRPRLFNGDVVVSLAIRTAERRLIYDDTDRAVAEVQEVLWETALRLEEGDLSIAERDLRRAQQALEEALNDPEATQEELNRLMDELQQAMDRFLQAMTEKMQRQLEQGVQPQQIPENAQILNSQDLRNMVERMREMTETGARDAAKQMLSQLQNMLENLRNAQPMTGQQSQQAQQAQEMMENMRALAERQRELLDQSFRMQQQQGQPGQQQGQGQQGMRMPGDPGQQGMQGPQGQQGHQGQMNQGQLGQGRQDGPGAAARQEALRRSLGRMMRDLANQLGEIPGPLGRAEQEMRDAARALQQGQPGQATGPQQNALDQLQQGMQAMQQAMQQQQGNQPGQGTAPAMGQRGLAPGQQQDPLGRNREDGGRASSNEDVQIPEETQLQRSREILDELRQRSGDRSRPEFERNYIDRLLNRF